MITYAIINQKGGVGKTTTAHAIGSCLAWRDYRTLFVDLDPQGNLTDTLCGSCATPTALDIMRNTTMIREAIKKSKEADYIPSDPELAAIDKYLTGPGKEYMLKEALAAVDADYDYCIIDTPPALGLLTVSALAACQKVIIPAQADPYSLKGISQLGSTLEAVCKYCNPTLQVDGIVLTRFNKRSIIKREVAEMLEETAKQFGTKLYKTRIRECTALVEAQAKKQSIFMYAAMSNAAADYAALVGEILENQNQNKEKK